MATLCKNCCHALIFNPQTQKLECSYCGSRFKPEDVESEAKPYREDLEAEAASEVFNSKEEQLMDCYVYSCSECGGEIIINGTEASTTCIFCGNPNVVFSRIAKMKAPEYILPFRITKGEAVMRAREAISKGAFVPSGIKNFSVDCCRGIYLPYWLVDIKYNDTVLIAGQTKKSGDKDATRYYGRSGYLTLKKFPVDASKALSDDSSTKLEPFNLKNLKPFDEDYLSGFYSDISDVTYEDVKKVALARGKEYFSEEAIKDVGKLGVKAAYVLQHGPSAEVDRDMKYAMLPAWFISFDYDGQHHTILVNGDTGKVVCGLPWRKWLFCLTLCGIAAVAAVLSFFVFKFVLTGMFSGDSDDAGGGLKMLIIIIGAIIMLFSTGIHKVNRVIENINLTQDKAIFNFMKKRQE